jgi:transmembrane sensor
MRPHYGHLAIAATFLICIIGVGLIVVERWPGLLPVTHVSVFETGVSEHRTIELSDGSTIQLGAKSAVTTNMGARLRTVVLDRGEALFTVAHDVSRPFRVMAGAGTITAIGTAFNVRRLEDHVVVTVTEGIVQIAPNSISDTREAGRTSFLATPDQPARQVAHGQQVTYDQSGRLSSPQFVDDAVSVGWYAGRMRYQGERLANVLTDVNRYARKPVVLGDPAAGELLYSGTVLERNVDEWLRNLETIFPNLQIDNDADSVMIRSRQLTSQP